jgi:zinc transporter ZupT
MSLEKTLLFFLLVFGSGLVSVLYFKANQRVIKLLMSFTGAYILGITFMHLVPAAYQSGSIWVGLMVLAGFMVQILLEGLSRGVEHGHLHMHENRNVNVFAIQVLLGLSIHSFIEGMPLASGFEELLGHGNDHSGHDHSQGGHDHHHHHHLLEGSTQLFWGIIAHHIPAAVALGALFSGAGFSRWITVAALLLFTLMTPLGAWTAHLFTWSELGFSLLMAFVIGTFLHVATTILFELEENHKISTQRLLVIFLGLLIAIGTSIL